MQISYSTNQRISVPHKCTPLRHKYTNPTMVVQKHVLHYYRTDGMCAFEMGYSWGD